jgi:mRNA interferase RelE/StbE
MTDPESARYRLQVTRPAARTLAGHLPKKIAAAVYEFVTTTLLENPRRVGKRLILPPFEGTWGPDAARTASSTRSTTRTASSP